MKPLFLLVVVVVGLLFVRPAGADEVAPALEGADLRVDATRAMAMLETRGIIGVYVAFDPNPSDPSAQAACDDDGDPVVVVSDAMLRLVTQITRLTHHDRLNRTATLEDYAAYVAANQAPGKRLLSPPPGTFEAGSPEDPIDHERVVAALVFVLGRELEHHRARDLVCPHPTATTETGDAIWTPAEQSAAVIARSIYRGDAAARDEAAIARVLTFTDFEEQAYAVLGFFARFEASPSRFVPSYVATHPGAAKRLANVKAIAAKRKEKAS